MAKKSNKNLRNLKSHTYDSQALAMLGALLCDVDSPQEAVLLLEELLTPAELSAIVNRVAILRELKNGTSYGEIQKKLGVSSATVASISESKSHPSIKRLFAKLHRQEQVRRVLGAVGKFFSIPQR